MYRRSFLTASLAAASLETLRRSPARASEPADSPAPAATSDLIAGSPVVSGPAGESITILQAISRPATGYVEFAIGDGAWQRVAGETAGLLPLSAHVLKFRLPPLPAGSTIRYRIAARSIHWKRVGIFVHGEIVAGEQATSGERQFRTLAPDAAETRFVVWNDTHENQATLAALAERTVGIAPDFLLWNGDQTNDVHDEAEIAGQVLTPGQQQIAANWPLAYVRGNHDLRGPAARHIAEFTGTPDDRFYYAFRSGPLAALVMDTGEDKPDDHPVFAGLAAFTPFRERQTRWLEETVQQPWFQQAPLRILFCHIPLWWVRDRRDIDYWEFSKVCRDAWVPILAKAGVQLVVSGHTHDHAWLPASAQQPLGQLVAEGQSQGMPR